MRQLTPQRRAAVITGACCAIIPSFALLMGRFHQPAVDAVCGFFIGLTFVLSIATLVRLRRSCA